MKGPKLILIQKHPRDEFIMGLGDFGYVSKVSRERERHEDGRGGKRGARLRRFFCAVTSLRERGYTLRSKEGKKTQVKRES